jgi:acetyl-CoA synthetase
LTPFNQLKTHLERSQFYWILVTKEISPRQRQMVKSVSLEQIIQCGVEQASAMHLLPLINQGLATRSAIAGWQYLTHHVLQPHHPFALHQWLYATTFADWDFSHNPPPAWFPTPEHLQTTNIAALMRDLDIHSYPDLHAWSTQNRTAFWQMMIERLGIRLRHPYRQLMDLSQGIESPQWLVDAQLNIVESCFQAPGDAVAIVFQSENSPLETWTYDQLHGLTNRVAHGLVNLGFQPGTAIAIDLPMTAPSIAIYLGIIQAGCVVVSIADSFAAHEIATRLRITHAKAIFTQDYLRRDGKLLSLYAKVIQAEAPPAIVLSCGRVPQVDLRSGDRTWDDFLGLPDQTLKRPLTPNSGGTEVIQSSPELGDLGGCQNDNTVAFIPSFIPSFNNAHFDAIPRPPTAHTNILFSSGTTGDPKAIPWTQTTPIKCAVDGHLHHDIHPGDVVAWATNLGWMMGPWLIYASLINRAAIALYEGAPTTRGYGQFIQNAQVTMLGVVPSLVSVWKTTQCMQGLDWSAIKAFSSTGECSNPQDMLFLMALAGYKPMIEYCGGTEIGGGYITGTLLQPCIPATFTTPALGLDFVILDTADRPTNKGEGYLIPPAIGLSTELLNQDHHQVYFKGTPWWEEAGGRKQEAGGRRQEAGDSSQEAGGRRQGAGGRGQVITDYRFPITDSPNSKSKIQNPKSKIPTPLRRHGDYLERLPNGYYRVCGRVDDTMNLGGIKVSSAEIEQALHRVADLQEAAAIAHSPPDGGPSQLIIYAVVANPTHQTPTELKADLQTAIAQQLNPLFKIHDVVIVESLPRTASNKVMRRVLRDRNEPS